MAKPNTINYLDSMADEIEREGKKQDSVSYEIGQIKSQLNNFIINYNTLIISEKQRGNGNVGLSFAVKDLEDRVKVHLNGSTDIVTGILSQHQTEMLEIENNYPFPEYDAILGADYLVRYDKIIQLRKRTVKQLNEVIGGI